ncbi:ATP-binding cassette sub-family B member 10, mitochondrial [Lethenteron reissneri]|uniref:ATP-binding cassette sub-family B member 10, mitochondrial n=1 Tax=Lethenteron reissneri TaxID=7753 RepID=UPI002AB69209|nr:ATP-binding cassette sub-family B member 10, mitochondrial [Lethenteron reissneri]
MQCVPARCPLLLLRLRQGSRAPRVSYGRAGRWAAPARGPCRTALAALICRGAPRLWPQGTTALARAASGLQASAERWAQATSGGAGVRRTGLRVVVPGLPGVIVPWGGHLGFAAPDARAWSLHHVRRFASGPDDGRGLKQAGDTGAASEVGGVKSADDSSKDLKKLMALARPESRTLAAAVGLLCISSVVTMSVPFCLGKVIDVINSTGGVDMAPTDLAHLATVLSGIFMAGAVANAGRVYLMQVSGQRIVQRLRDSLFRAIMRQELGFFDRTRTGELVNRLSADTALMGRAVTENLSDGLRSLAQVTVGIGMMFYVSPKLATFVLGVVPPIALIAVVYGRYLRRITKRTQDSLAEATQVAEERIGNIRTVRSFAKEELEMEKYSSKVNYVLQLAYKEALARAGFFGATGLSGNLIVLAVLYKGGLLMQSAHITVGDLSAFLLYSGWVGISIGGLSSFYSELMKGLGTGSRIWQLLDRQPTIPLGEGQVVPLQALRGEIEFRGVHFAYPTRETAPVFRSLDLAVPAGQVTAVVGPSGCGKSTLLSLLLRLYDPQQGQVLIDGQDVREVNPSWLRSQIGTVSQEPILFSCSIAENIAYGAANPEAASKADIARAAQAANAFGFIEGFPSGFDTVVGEKGVLLSGGQKQRIAIARAILKNPNILLLDEATSALDSESESLVQEALDRLMTGRTVLVIAHRLSTIQGADRIAVLERGRVAQAGTYAQLTADTGGMFHRLVERQTAAHHAVVGDQRAG